GGPARGGARGGGRGPVRPGRVVGAAGPVVETARAARGMGQREGLTASVPQPLQVPPVGAAVLIQIDDHAALDLPPPVLAFAAVLPPAALDPPPPDHVADLVAAAAPDERRR